MEGIAWLDDGIERDAEWKAWTKKAVESYGGQQGTINIESGWKASVVNEYHQQRKRFGPCNLRVPESDKKPN